MKRMIIFALLISGPCVAFAADGVMRTDCPSGYVRIEEPYHKLMDGVCVNGYRCLSFPVNTCLVDSPENVCYLFAERDVEYADTDGSKYKFSAMCPENGGTALSAYGATKCVKLPLAASESSNVSGWASNSIETVSLWAGTEVRIVGACSNSYGNASGDTSTGLGYDTDGDQCWCKMISPVSTARWFFAKSTGSISVCNKTCGMQCWRSFLTDSAFRNAMLSDNLLG